MYTCHVVLVDISVLFHNLIYFILGSCHNVEAMTVLALRFLSASILPLTMLSIHPHQ